MGGLADFLDSLIGGVDLTFYSISIGGLWWAAIILKPWRGNTEDNKTIVKQCIHISYLGTYALIITQVLQIILKIWLMAATLERWPLPELMYTIQFKAGFIRTLAAVVLTVYLKIFLKHHFTSRNHWLIALFLTVPLISAGAWLVHASSRLEYSEMLMVLSVVHQLFAALWIGGLVQFLLVWKLYKQQSISFQYWPTVLHRFSQLGIVAVMGLIISGLSISYHYFPDLNGIVGTAYGNLLIIKIMMLVVALYFALTNRKAVNKYFLDQNEKRLRRQTPYFIEAETLVLVCILFTAASLASQPPAIDIPLLTSDWKAVLQTFTPRIPRLTSPSHEALLAGEAGRVAIIAQIPSAAATDWSDYNHNISGIFLTVISLLAMISYKSQSLLKDIWPIGFVALGIFLFFRSDAETWPLGPLGFWESTLNNGEVLQHRIATLLVFMLGIIELKARLTKAPHIKLPYLFPLLSTFGGLMLLAHSHVGFQPKSSFLIQVSHTLIGFFSLILACGRWLELKLDYPGNKIAGFVSVFALFQIGMILMFYREPLY